MSDNVTDAVFSKGTLMDLDIGRWTGRRKLVANDVLLEDDSISESVIKLGHKKLMPKDALGKLIGLEANARVSLAAKSMQFPLSGARFVYYPALPMILAKLKVLKTEWEAALEELIKEYPKLKHEQLELFDAQNLKRMKQELAKTNSLLLKEKEKSLQAWFEAQRAENEALYPDPATLRSKFRFEWRTYKISAMEGTSAMSTIAEDEMVAAQQAIKGDMQKWVKDAAKEMHLVLGQAAAHATKMMKEQGKLNAKNLKPLFEAFESFQAVDFTGASDFQAVVDKVKKEFAKKKADGSYDFGDTAEGINSTETAKEAFSALLTGMAELATEEVAEKAGLKAVSVGEFSRVLDED